MPDPTYSLIVKDSNGKTVRVEGPTDQQTAVTRVALCMKANGHGYEDGDLEFRLRKSDEVGDKKGWRYKVIANTPVPDILGQELEPTLDEINTAIVRVECLTRANWHEPEQMVVARNSLRGEAEVLQDLVNKVRRRLGVKTVKAV